MSMTLDEFTRSVDPRCLPRILQIQSGIYVQGSVYEMYGRECCLSNGDLIKVIEIRITRFIAKGSNGITVDLPLDYPGLFRMVKDRQPYCSIQEIAESLRISSHRLGHPVFYTADDLDHPDGTIKKGASFRITGLKTVEDHECVDCELAQSELKRRFALKLSVKGEFYECDDSQFYTLKELAEWKMSTGRTRTVTKVKSTHLKDDILPDPLEDYKGELTLTPVHEIQAIMKFRKDVVLIPPNLDVDVVDVTEQHDSAVFVQPLSLKDVFKKPMDTFPVVAEVIEKPWHVPEELAFICHSKQVVIQRAFEAKRVLASETRRGEQRRFLVPSSYKGRFKRRPREFPTAYDLERAQSSTEQLHVVATRAFESHYFQGQSPVQVGDQFLIKKKSTSSTGQGSENGEDKMADMLACMKIEGKSHKDVQIPMYLDGGFVEVIHDKRQYTIGDICHGFPLPFNVKVSVRDLAVKEDILAAASGLQVEEEITDPHLLVSTLDLSECWEVPVNRTKMTVQLQQKWEGPATGAEQPVGHAVVEEIGEDCYYNLRRYAVANLQPPPRPPKIKIKQPMVKPPRPNKPIPSSSPKSPHCNSPKPGSMASDTFPRLKRNTIAVSSERRSSIPPVFQPITVATVKSKDIPQEPEVDDLDDDSHEYEYIDEDELEFIRKKVQDATVLRSTVKGKQNTF
ncbi:protein THEMIS [Alosa pseudoharengus]|uniref:protein THEMIS n=1 Tax=Alosa pseudoharengus TaxID=34774 RepID=UPI003F8B5BDF